MLNPGVSLADDDAGGFYDSVIPPFEGVPNDVADCHVKDGCPTQFDFRRLGSRLPALVRERNTAFPCASAAILSKTDAFPCGAAAHLTVD